MRALRLLVWIATLAVSLAVLHRTGSGSLAPPPMSADGARRWLADRDAVTAAFALVRLVALALGWYLAALTLLRVVATSVGWARLVTITDIVTAPALRPFLRGAAGASLGATVVLAAPAAAFAGPSPDVASTTPVAPATPSAPGSPAPGADVMVLLPDGAEAPAVPDDDIDSVGIAVMHAIPDETSDGPRVVTTSEPAPRPPPAPPTPVAASPAAPPGGAEDTWIVAPGDHLWSISDQTLADAWGRAPSEDEVTVYWASVVAANRSRLADPTNPDLVFSGEIVVLPPVPPPPPPPAAEG